MSRSILPLASLVAALVGCATARPAARPEPGDSVFAKLGQDAQVERAVEDLLGEGVGVKVAGQTALGFPVEEPYSARSYADHAYLRRAVIEPVVRRPEVNQALQQARCGAGKDCEGRVTMRELETPAVKLALIRALLAGHPRREALLDGVYVRLADQVGGQRRSVCYVAAGATGPELTLGNRGCSGVHPYSDATFYELKPVERRTLSELEETEGLLANVGAGSALEPAARERLARVRDAQRVVLAHVAKNATGRRRSQVQAKARSRASTPPPRG